VYFGAGRKEMAVLYVDEYGCKVRFSGGLVVVESHDGRELASVRLQELEYVVIMENASITSAAATALLRGSVPVAFLSHGGEYLGKLEPPVGKNVLLRRAQYKASDDPSFCLEISRAIVYGKLANMRTILMRYARNKPELDFLGIESLMRSLLESVKTASDITALLGLEGNGTRYYFSIFPIILPEPWKFEGRSRRPPRDPVNAMLSFAYALLENEIENAISICGLDPYCGFFHQDAYGRQSLVLDLMEEFRPVIADSVVLNCCIRRMIDPVQDFEERDGGVFLNEQGRQKFFRIFDARMKTPLNTSSIRGTCTYRSVCESQARMLARCLTDNSQKYVPYTVK
jgi:CRISPR-associated protein Cas1